MLHIITIAAMIISMSIVMYLTPRLLLLSLRKRMVDNADGRKIHTTTASRLGGLSFLPAILLSVSFCFSFIDLYDYQLLSEKITIKFILGACSLLILYLVGFYDDVLGVRYKSKFFFQFIASVLVVLSGTWIKNFHGFLGIGEVHDVVGMSLTIFLFIFIMNSINFIDGIDGLASLLSIFALLVYGTIFVIQSSFINTLVTFATLGALIPFFYFNMFRVRRKYASKIFMGDTGSLIIGFILGITAVNLWNMNTDNNYAYPYVLSYTMLIIPCFDTIRVVLLRMKNHKSLFLPDKNHIHHILIQSGLSQHKVLLIIILADAFLLLLNFFLANVLNITFILIIDIICVTLYVRIIKKAALIK